MSTEKIIKTQSKKYLSGNWITVISAILFVCVVAIVLEGLFYLITLYFKIINVETGTVYSGRDWLYTIILLATSLITFLLSPMINGIYRITGNIAREKPCEINDMFYFFGNLRRYMRTVIMNTILFVFFMFACEITDVYDYTCYILNADYYRDFGFNLTTLVLFLAGVISFVIKALLYLIILNYPMIAYSFDDSKGLMKYIFGYLRISFKYLGKTIKLCWSFIGLILSCFFVAPAFYVVPYLLTALANSAKWLFSLELKSEFPNRNVVS